MARKNHLYVYLIAVSLQKIATRIVLESKILKDLMLSKSELINGGPEPK